MRLRSICGGGWRSPGRMFRCAALVGGWGEGGGVLEEGDKSGGNEEGNLEGRVG